ncbi:MAG: putative DNA-binding domain-containing protein [Salinarimonas sp.]|nr:putative DNA-binding domain-containing protein [Salinarimonas sp.]
MSMPHEDTHDGQAAFARALFGETPPAGLAPYPPEIARARFAIYRNNVASSLIKALETRFPVIERLVGEAFFKGVAHAFIKGHPPRSPVLMEYGDAFPDFLAAFPPAQSLPYLADVARIEYARGEAYRAEDAEPVPPAALAGFAEADPDTLCISLHPSLRLVASDHPAFSIWRMNQPGATPQRITAPQPETALVARPHDGVITLSLPAGEAAFIAALRQDPHFARAAETAFARDPAFEPGYALGRAVSLGLVTALDISHDNEALSGDQP